MKANLGRRQLLKLLCLMPILYLQRYASSSHQHIHNQEEFLLVDGWILKQSDLPEY
jgi:hypothetical protein